MPCPCAHAIGHEVVCGAHVPADVALDLDVFRRLGDALHPEAGEQDPGSAHLVERGAEGVDFALLAEGSHLLLVRDTEAGPGLVHARQPERPLRGEVAVDDRLRDTGLPCDLGRRRAGIATGAEDSATPPGESRPDARPPEGVSRDAPSPAP